MSKRNALMEDSVSLEVVFEDETNKLKLKSDDQVIAQTELPAGGSSVAIAGPVGATAISGDECVTIKWSDPGNTVIEGITLAEWGKTVLVRKEGTNPTNPSDGDVLATSTIRDQYATTGYVDKTVENGKEYHYGIFPATKGNKFNLETCVTGLPVESLPAAATGLSVTTAQGSAQVTFTTPANAESVALVYKKDSAPTSDEDAGATKVDGYTSGATITGLEDEATYYFVIYTYKTNINNHVRKTPSSAISGVIKSTVDVPTPTSVLVYNGSSQNAPFTFDSTKLTMSGATSGTNADSYIAKFTPKGNFIWSDTKGTEERSVTWTIGKAPITDLPVQNNTLTYSGSAQSPSWSNYSSTELTISGDTSKTDAGTYHAIFTPTSNYKWSDGSASKSADWVIGRQKISTVPTQKGTITYNGQPKSPEWDNYDSNQLTLDGTTTGTNATSYTATFTPKANYEWSNDGSQTARNATWSIGKAAGSFSLSATSLTLNVRSSPTGSITVSSDSDGEVSVSPATSSIATISVSGKTINFTATAKGTATFTVSMAAGSNHNAPADTKTISLTCKTVEPVNFPDATPDQIGELIDAAYDGDIDLSTIWSVGNEMTVDLAKIDAVNNQNVAHVAQKMVLTVLGFNHDDLVTAVNGKTKAAVTLGFKYTMGNAGNQENDYYWGKSYYPVQDSDNYSASPFRNFLNGPLKNALPAAIRSKIKKVKKKNLSSHTGTGTIETQDDLFLLSYPEVFGTATYGNYLSGGAVGSYEGTQYKYFETSSNRQKKVNNNGAASSNNGYYWLRSPSSYYNSSYGYSWMNVNNNGNANNNYGNGTYGVVAAFCL